MFRRRLTGFLVALSAVFTPALALAADQGAAPSAWARAIAWIFQQQREFHRELIHAVEALQAGEGMLAGLTLIAASFLYGIFHAAGPGHGKAVISAYLATQPENRRRGVLLSVLAAFCQGLTALVLVYGVVYAANLLPRESSEAVNWSERASFSLVALMGVFLIWRAVRSLRSSAAAGHGDDSCDHDHGPSPEQISRATDLRGALGIILSIGLRPCSGAVIVLVFAQASGLALAGVFAVLAMSAGTAVTVAGLALFVVSARTWIGSRINHTVPARRIGGAILSVAGGAMLVAIGASLLEASFQPRHPMGL